MPSTIHKDAFHFGHPVQSWWEASAAPLGIVAPPLAGDQSCDIAIIGAGFTGLSAALELAREHHVDVRVLEAATVGWGASGRNGGFCCIGGHKRSYQSIIAEFGLEETRKFYTTLKDATHLVEALCKDEAIDAGISGRGEVCLAHLPNRMEDFREEQAFMRATFGEETELLSPGDLKERGLHGPAFHGGIANETGVGVHPLNYARGLARAAARAGAKIHGGSELIRWEEGPQVHVLTTRGGTLKAKRVIVASNGYTPEDVSIRHQGRLLPALSSVIVTRPLTEAERLQQGWTTTRMAFDSRILLHYFRLLPDGRFLFGGRGGTDASNAGHEPQRQRLTAHFHSLFPAWRGVDITHYWRGFVCLTADRLPYVGPLDDRKSVWTSIAYHGNGVALATWSGRALARAMMGKDAAVPVPMTKRLAKFPFASLRSLYLKGAYVWYELKDRI
jgi:glycine/D-amino acid oxidase-like deaminating enzyme